ncbi:MAG: cytochrome c-type biogenesis protein [Aquisalimonadaceae bacterium]
MSRLMQPVLMLLLLLMALSPAWAQEPGLGADTPTPQTADVPAFEDQDRQQRYVGLLRKLRCLVCQNESLAESNAGLARDLRRIVHTRLEAGQSDEQILAFMTERYGDFVLYRPPVRPSTYALWFGPAVLLLIGIGVIARMVFRRQAPGDRPPLSEADRRRAAALLDENEGRSDS